MSGWKFSWFTKKEIFWLFLLLVFSSLLMWKTFELTSTGDMQIATKAWSDFAATIPLIRSFSYGDNFPPQYPLYAGPPIRYHFVFFLLVGLLEKIGIPLDWALNSLSGSTFFALLVAIYSLAKKVFKSTSVGYLSVIFFLLNGSFAFLEFFKKNPLSFNSFSQIIQNTNFSSFGPYDGKIVSAFWSLNIFTNQRHLALAYAAFLGLLFFIYHLSINPKGFSNKKILFLGILIGLFPFVHTAVFGMMGILLATSLVVYPKIRGKILLTGIIAVLLAIPQIAYMGKSEVVAPLFNPGYLVEKLNLEGFLSYWFLNLGLLTALTPLGFFLSKRQQKKIFLPFMALFIIGNIFQFSPEIAANHKFFNLFVIGSNMFASFALITIWRKGLYSKVCAIILTFFLILSGLIDIFPIFNDSFITIKDIPNNKAVGFIKENTPKDSVFLNATFLYDPASLAGRKIFLGWPYFSWSAGYNTTSRYKKMIAILTEYDKGILCSKLFEEKIDFVEIQKPSKIENAQVKYQMFEKNMQQVFLDADQNITIYDVRTSCGESSQ